LNSGKPLGTGRCEWLWVFALCPSEPLTLLIPFPLHIQSKQTDKKYFTSR